MLKCGGRIGKVELRGGLRLFLRGVCVGTSEASATADCGKILERSSTSTCSCKTARMDNVLAASLVVSRIPSSPLRNSAFPSESLTFSAASTKVIQVTCKINNCFGALAFSSRSNNPLAAENYSNAPCTSLHSFLKGRRLSPMAILNNAFFADTLPLPTHADATVRVLNPLSALSLQVSHSIPGHLLPCFSSTGNSPSFLRLGRGIKTKVRAEASPVPTEVRSTFHPANRLRKARPVRQTEEVVQQRSHVGRVDPAYVAARQAAEEARERSGGVRHGGIHLIMGPMFAGKTTELLLRLEGERKSNRRVEVVKSSIDTRYSLTQVVSHDGLRMDCDAVAAMAELHARLLPGGEWEEVDVIGIDEAQFLSGLVRFCEVAADKYGKTVVVAGLDGDFRRRKFGEILDLVPLADSVSKLSSKCRVIGPQGEPCGQAGLFTFRMTSENATELVGGAEVYTCYCRAHYLKAEELAEQARRTGVKRRVEPLLEMPIEEVLLRRRIQVEEEDAARQVICQ
eukprot:TRINITY_DN8071_c1_g2_i7.p1 TRINITY_DN8071_c1_g2~~TRINITY_DN8071_c1_g2_i7.p1  ORF type:complete len:512 (-),score=47.11 TRINITY_DN8071_c1_g2_i7:379-1914(-)